MDWGKEEGIQYHLLEDSFYNNLRKHTAQQILSLGMWHTCLRQPPFATRHESNGKVQLYGTLLKWGDRRCLGEVVRQLLKSSV